MADVRNTNVADIINGLESYCVMPPLRVKIKKMKRYNISLLFQGLLLLFACYTASAGTVVIENDNFRYEISSDGRNLHFVDKATGIDYLDAIPVSYCAYITKNGKQYHTTSVSLKNNLLTLEFGASSVAAEILIGKARDRITMEVTAVEGSTDSLSFINVPLKLAGMPNDPFAACVLSMNLFTQVNQLPPLQTNLLATCYNRFGMKGAKITLIGVPQKNILPVIRDIMEHAEDIPHSDKGGAWAQTQQEGYGSYLMNFGTLTEKTVDEWIGMCKSLGFNQIDNHGGGIDFFKFGDFELNKDKWPDGWNEFKRINKRLHDAGILSIFHTYAFFIDKNSKYVTPVPNPDLGYSNIYTLAEPVGADDKEIGVKESTANISTTTGFLTANSVTLRIGNELITFKGATVIPPYKFTGCTRGVNGTKVSSHSAVERAFQLKEKFGKFVPAPESALYNEIAKRTADVVNECNFDGIYFDAIDGGSILDGNENSWYYGTKFIFEVVKNLDHPVGMEMSAMTHQWWHYRDRWQAWDRPVRGYKRFIDIHAASIKSNVNAGVWKGYSPFIDKYASAENGSLLLPLHFGWWGFQTWNPPQVEPTYPDDIEYLCCKMIGNKAGLSMLGGVDTKTLNDNPLFKRLSAIIRQYEELRHKNYFGDSIRTLLRQPGKEFSLFQNGKSEWNFKPVAYQKHKVTGLKDSSASWTVHNDFSLQPVRLRIEPLMTVKSYDDPDNIVMADFSKQENFSNEGAANGIFGAINISNEKLKNGEVVSTFSGLSKGLSPIEGSWIKFEKKFEPLLNLEKNQALGVWIKGDGNGELLNFRLESPENLSYGARGDHFVKIDFTGWKYFELVEIESSEFSNYIWPDDRNVYSTYRTTIKFQSIDKLQLWYNNLPKGKEIKCLIAKVKALPMVSVTIDNPAIMIGNKKIVFPVRMESGMYLEFNSASDCKLYSSKGELLKEISILGSIPSISSGENEISFTCNNSQEMSTRLQVTIVTEGKPLKNK
jgi:hypothetical protein